MLWAVPLGLCSGEGCSKNGVSAVVALLHHDCGDGLVATRDASSGNWQFSDGSLVTFTRRLQRFTAHNLSLIHISEPTRLGMISYAVFCLKKKKK